MGLLPTGGLLDHVEKTLADSYRKEIDQEENMWRSLPFFAASLALQIAATVGMVSGLPPLTGWRLPVIAGLFAAAGTATVATLAFLAASIAPARFRYVSPEPDLRDYALALARAEAVTCPEEGRSEVSASSSSPEAITAFKNEMARQYGIATHHNRLVNQKRALRRALAGLCMIGSILAMLALLGVAVSAHIERAASAVTGANHGRLDERRDADENSGRRTREAFPAERRDPSGTRSAAGDAGGPEGVVGEYGGSGVGERLGAGGP